MSQLLVSGREYENTTIQPAQKPAIITDIGMFAWLLGIMEQNPVVVVIVVAIIAALMYFGWYKRRQYF
ncbi:MAG: hypothetical protein OS112_08915 [Methanoregula sp.]|nr:MAG: hypothetical protein OS112_08915 [Methanoregula sp.]